MKIGDRVKCINPYYTDSSSTPIEFLISKPYFTITKVTSLLLTVDGHTTSWYIHRFKLVNRYKNIPQEET